MIYGKHFELAWLLIINIYSSGQNWCLEGIFEPESFIKPSKYKENIFKNYINWHVSLLCHKYSIWLQAQLCKMLTKTFNKFLWIFEWNVKMYIFLGPASLFGHNCVFKSLKLRIILAIILTILKIKINRLKNVNLIWKVLHNTLIDMVALYFKATELNITMCIFLHIT